MSTPDLNAALDRARRATEAFQASSKRHGSDEARGKGYAFDVQLLEERDDIAGDALAAFAEIDAVMSRRSVLNSPAPSAWKVDRLTDEQLATAKAHWPELDMFDDTTIRQVADALGIRMVRELAREAVRNAPGVLAARNGKG